MVASVIQIPDLWLEQKVEPRLRNRAFLIRHADDFAIWYRDGRDTQRVMKLIPTRSGKLWIDDPPHQVATRPLSPVVALAERFDERLRRNVKAPAAAPTRFVNQDETSSISSGDNDPERFGDMTGLDNATLGAVITT